MRVLSLLIFISLFFPSVIPYVKLSAEEISCEKILSTLFNKNEFEANKILSYIYKVKPPQLPSMLANVIIKDNSIRSKKTAIKALKRYPLRRYVPLWLEILKKTDSFLIKKQVIDIIAVSDDRRIVMPLVEELSNPFYSVRKSAILALKHTGDDRMFPHILNLSKSDDPIFRVYSLEAIYHLYDRRMYYILMDMLKDENKSVRYYALRCIEKNRLNQALPHVRNVAIHDDNFEVRVRAIEILGSFRDYNSQYLLIRSLSDSERSIRYASAISLYLLNIQKAAYSLSSQLYNENDDSIKEIIIETLVKLKNAGGFKGLRKVLDHDKNPKLKVLAAYALGKINDRRAISLLLKALSDEKMKVRAEVCNSLGFYKDKIVVRQLLNIINNDKYRYVRTAALYAIMCIRDKSSILPLFDRYTVERDPIFKEKLRFFLRECIKKYI